MNNSNLVTTALDAVGLHKTFHDGDAAICVLDGVDLRVGRGERVAILGRSGSGKSTLLHVLAGLDDADSGTVTIAGEQITGADAATRAGIRNRNMGFVYQLHHLLAEFSALENVAMPLRLGGLDRDGAALQAAELLDEVGLADRASHRPAQLSGGERQRVAVARALAGSPALMLADEPTGNLDAENAARVFELLLKQSRERGVALVIVTHDRSLLDDMDRVLTMRDGVLE